MEKPDIIETGIKLIVDCKSNLAGLIVNSRCLANKKINEENFLLNENWNGKVVELKCSLIRLNQCAAYDHILNSMLICPSGLEELLAFSNLFPDKQKEYPIMALGQTAISIPEAAAIFGKHGSACYLDYRETEGKVLLTHSLERSLQSSFVFLVTEKDSIRFIN